MSCGVAESENCSNSNRDFAKLDGKWMVVLPKSRGNGKHARAGKHNNVPTINFPSGVSFFHYRTTGTTNSLDGRVSLTNWQFDSKTIAHNAKSRRTNLISSQIIDHNFFLLSQLQQSILQANQHSSSCQSSAMGKSSYVTTAR